MQSTRKLIRAEKDGSATTRKKTVREFETLLKTCVLALLLGLGVPAKKENRIFHFFTFCLLSKNAKFRSNLFCETVKKICKTRNAKISQKKILQILCEKMGNLRKKMQNFREHYLKRLNTILNKKISKNVKFSRTLCLQYFALCSHFSLHSCSRKSL